MQVVGSSRRLLRWAAGRLPGKEEFMPVLAKVCFDRDQLENGTVPLCGFMTSLEEKTEEWRGEGVEEEEVRKKGRSNASCPDPAPHALPRGPGAP